MSRIILNLLKMKSSINLFAILFAIFFISSCGDGDKNISEIELIPVKNGNEFQYIDREGKIVINPQFSVATIFRDGLALVKTSGSEPKWGFITEEGKFAINANYKSATVFSDGLAWVVAENAPPTLINTKGEAKFTLQDAETVRNFKEGLAAFSVIDSSGVKWGFVDNTGKVKINPQFLNTGSFSNGKCAVENSEEKWGYIDKDGKIIINYQFDNAKKFIDGKAIVVLDQKAGLIDEQGKYIINPQFSTMANDGDRFLIEQNEKWGWCDSEGKITINPQFSDALPFLGNDFAAVKSGKSWGYIDIEGKSVINPQFDIAFPYNGKLALVLSGGKIGFIDGEGKYIINPQFDAVSDDMIPYMLGVNSEFESVETDFFNITPIVNMINVNKPKGLTLSSNLSDVISTLKITESEFDRYRTEHMVIRDEKVTRDVSYNFYVMAEAYLNVRDGWNTKTVFNPNAIVQGFAYVFDLEGKALGREKEVMEAIEKSFTGFKKDDQQSTDESKIYTNNNQLIRLFLSGNRITVVIANNIQNTSQEEETGD